MDLVCTKCGEPWDLDEVDDMPGLVMEGSRIIKCPCCPESDDELSDDMKERAMMASAIADVMGDDLDGAASEMDGL